jgi:hypothetical protein
MNDAAHMRSGSAETLLELHQTIAIESDQIASMIADHYAQRGLRFHPSYVQLRVHGSSGGGYSSTSAGFDGATIRLNGDLAAKAEEAGMPSVLELTQAAVANILVSRIHRSLERDVPASAVRWDVLDAGGAGFGSHAAKLNRATVNLKIEA